ncbi:zinc ion binding / nucleic acid binding protein [Thalictrum thalictroides]|uniref:Zinc ion binding / nucleic acid binding protein n=1 Tax=Thalictrum thalictroides TaxID=46969 RepID=A0A7J6W4L2_THATH|nr:zinc ion binding / nucleic acid binding protein [Thalictrum thalictroides]
MASIPFGLGVGRNYRLYPCISSNVLQFNKEVQGTKIDEATKSNDKMSFAEKAKQGSHAQVQFASLLTPGFRGDYPTIKILTKDYERGLEYCKHSLIARMDLKDISLEALKLQASQKWKPKGNWNITSLGKGYLHVRFEEREDFDAVWTGGPWRFGNQLMRLQEWSKNFKPDTQKQTKPLVWIKLPNLPMECWDLESIMLIARGVGYPMKVDDSTLYKTYGYYAHVLVDVDLTKTIPNQILVETVDSKFWQDVEVGKLPKFCNHCKMVGHVVSECKKIKAQMGKNIENEGTKNGTKKIQQQKKAVETKIIPNGPVWRERAHQNSSNIEASTSGVPLVDKEHGTPRPAITLGNSRNSHSLPTANRFQVMADESKQDQEDLEQEYAAEQEQQVINNDEEVHEVVQIESGIENIEGMKVGKGAYCGSVSRGCWEGWCYDEHRDNIAIVNKEAELVHNMMEQAETESWASETENEDDANEEWMLKTKHRSLPLGKNNPISPRQTRSRVKGAKQ